MVEIVRYGSSMTSAPCSIDVVAHKSTAASRKGQVLMEDITLTRRAARYRLFMDYDATPTTSAISSREQSVPTKTNRGNQGAGESRQCRRAASGSQCAGRCASEFGVKHIEMPATPGGFGAQCSRNDARPVQGRRLKPVHRRRYYLCEGSHDASAPCAYCALVLQGNCVHRLRRFQCAMSDASSHLCSPRPTMAR